MKAKIITGAILFFVAFIFIAFSFCFEIVPLDRVGVRSNQFSGGVEKRDLQPGLWLVVPGMHKMDVMDPTVQVLVFARDSKNGPIYLRTKDQYKTQVDISITYRIQKGYAWSVRQSMGMGHAFVERFRQQAQAAIWEVMAKMRTEDFYDSDVRTQAAKETVKVLNKAMEGQHLVADNLLVRKLVFDPKFEQKLIKKQLLGQQRLLAESKKIREDELSKTQMIQRETGAKVLAIQEEMKKSIVTLTARTEAEIAQIRADAQYTVRKLMAEAERSRREKIAEGERLKETARAKGQKALNDAYQSRGGKLLLSRKMLENMSIGKVEINTNLTNPFDVDQFLRLVGAGEK